jgi:galactonate dehydratase
LIKEAHIHCEAISGKTVWRHILLHTADHVGVGEFTLDSAGPGFEDRARSAAASIVGRNVGAELIGALGDLAGGDLEKAAIASAIDQANHDILAQSAGISLAAYLGGRDGLCVPLYANINRRTEDRSSDGFRRSAERAGAGGFGAVKVAPFDKLAPGIAETEEGKCLARKALERIGAVRDALGGAVQIYVDCHWRLTPRLARDLLPELGAHGVTWFECPLLETRENIAEIVDLRRRANELGIRLAGCETMTLWQGFRPFVEAGAYDVIMPDVKYVGGYAALHEIVERASEHGVAVSLHNPSGPVCHLHSMHASVAFGLTERLEMQFDESPKFMTIVRPSPPNPVGGEVAVPSTPGLGAQLAREAV